MLGIVSLGDAERFGLRTAALQTTEGTYVAATDKSLTAAAKLMTQKDELGPFAVTQKKLLQSGAAYPGTMLVFTTARLQNLPADDAKKVASFIRISTTEGQQVGRGNGQLPAGYVPIKKSGPTAALWRAAQRTADAVEAQKGLPDDADAEPSDEDPPVPGGPDDTVPDDGLVDVPPAAEAPAPAAGGEPGVSDDPFVTTAATPGADSLVGGGLLPLLILLVFGGAASWLVSSIVGRRKAHW